MTRTYDISNSVSSGVVAYECCANVAADKLPLDGKVCSIQERLQVVCRKTLRSG